MRIAQDLSQEDINTAIKVLKAYAAYGYACGNDEAARDFKHMEYTIMYKGSIPELQEGDLVRLRPSPFMVEPLLSGGLPTPPSVYAVIKNGRAVKN